MFNRIPITCVACKKELKHPADIWGDVGQELCVDCYWSIATDDDDDFIEYVYGVGPHHHDFTLTGSWIGSTVDDPLPDNEQDGWHWIENQKAWFRPDPEVPGLGTWRYKRV